MSPPRLTLQTLGGARVAVSPGAGDATGDPLVLLDGGKPVALLAYVACVPGRQARREQLVDLLWADLEPDAAKHALRQTIWYIKKRLGEGILIATPDALSISPALAVDRDALMAHAEANRHEAVLDAYAGDFLPDFAAPGGADFEAWADVERRRLRSLFFRATEASVRDLLGRGRARDAFARARRARDHDPTAQGAWRLVLESLIAAQEWTQAQVEAEAMERVVARDEGELEPASRALLRLARKGPVEPAADGGEGGGLTAQLVGREREFALLLEGASQAQRGRGAHLHVRAAAGLGKSRLLGDVAARLRSTRARVVQVRCDLGARELPFAAASDVALAMGRLPGARGISPESAATLVAMAPGLSTYFTAEGDASTGSEALRRRAQAMAELAGAVCEDQALVLLVDDVHWMDVESRTVLGQLASRAPSMRLLVVTAGRPVLEGRLEAPDARTLDLLALTEGQCAELLESIATLGTAPWALAFVHDLWRASGGSPLHALETLQLLRERELLDVTDGEWRATQPEALFALLRAGGVLARRLERLTRSQSWLLVLLAVTGMPADEALLARAEGGDAAPRGELSELERRGFVARAEGGWGLAHDEIGMTVLERATAETVRAAHAAIGRGLWQMPNPDLSTMRRAAQHLLQGGETAALHALFGTFVRRMRSLGDARPNVTLAEDLAGRQARVEAVQAMVRSLPWHVRYGLTSTRRVAVVAAAILLIVLVPTAWAVVRSAQPRPPVPVAELLVVGRADTASRAYRIPIVLGEWVPGRPLELADTRAESVSDPWVSWPILELPGRHGEWIASRATGDSGVIDVYVDARGTRRRVTFAKGDDLLGDVSPDGKQVVVATARFNEDSHYDIAVVSLADGHATMVTEGDDTDQHPRWSHAGDRLAFVRRSWVDDRNRICLVNPDGSDLDCPEGWRGLDALVGWVDEHRILATRNGERFIEAVVADERDGSIRSVELRSQDTPVLSPDGRWLVCRCERLGYDKGTWFVMPLGRESEARPLVLPASMASARIGFSSVGRRPPISALSIEQGVGTPVVGIPHLFTARGVTHDHLTDDLPHVRWSSDDPATLSIDSLTGLATPRRPGRVRVRAALPGWVRAEGEVEVRGTMPASLAAERWDSTWTSRWYDFGTPRPTLVTTPDGNRLNTNGDKSFTSGVLSRATYDVSQGLTIDFDLQLRITRAQWQSIKVGVAAPLDLERVPDAERDDGSIHEPADRLMTCSIAVPAGEGVSYADKFVVAEGTQEDQLPLPAGVPGGRRMHVRLAFFPDGRCGIAVEGRPVYLSMERMNELRTARLHVSGSAVGTTTSIGPIEVWRGIRPGIDWGRAPARPSAARAAGTLRAPP